MKLSKAEEQLMEIIWTNKELFLKDIIEQYPDPKPANTTVATFLKRLQDKGVVGYKLFGKSRQYYPLIKKEKYFSNTMSGIVENYFNNSALQFASFFTRTGKLTDEELKDLKKLIDLELEKRKK